jgi:hypothetical protein
MQALWLCAGRPRASPDCHGKEGSPVRVRQRALENRATARFSCFRSGSDDRFRALLARRGQAWPRAGSAPPLARPRSASRSRPRYRRGTRRTRRSRGTVRRTVDKASTRSSRPVSAPATRLHARRRAARQPIGAGESKVPLSSRASTLRRRAVPVNVPDERARAGASGKQDPRIDAKRRELTPVSALPSRVGGCWQRVSRGCGVSRCLRRCGCRGW